MSEEILRKSNNKYDIYFLKTIIEASKKLKLNDEQKELFFDIYNEKKKLTMESYCKPIKGFSGPYRAKYLKGYAPQFKGKFFDNLEDVLKEFKKDDFSYGITLTRNGKYTIRRGEELMQSKINSNGTTEISWIYEPLECKESEESKEIKCEIIIFKNEKYFFDKLNYKVYDMNKHYVGDWVRGSIKEL